MLKVHVAERVAVSAGSAAPKHHRMVPLGVMAIVLAAVVGLMGLYAEVRELAQPSGAHTAGLAEVSERELQRIAPAAGPEKLMSIEDMKRLSGQD